MRSDEAEAVAEFQVRGERPTGALGPHLRAVVRSADCAEVDLAQLRSGPSPRSGRPDPRHVRALAETFAELPPILVHRATMTVIDGAHRLEAARTLGRTRVSVVFFDGDESAAYVEAVRRNIAHGRPLSIKDREKAVIRMLASHQEWSDRRLADICGLSNKTVAKLRERWTSAASSPTTRLGRDGRRRPTDPAAQRMDVARVLAQHPHASLQHVADVTGSSLATVSDVRRRLRQGESPLPPRLSRGWTDDTSREPGAEPEREPAPRRWQDDAALRSTPQGSELARWLDQHHIDDDHWRRLVGAVPVSRVYELAAEASRRARSWERLAEALEGRVRSGTA